MSDAPNVQAWLGAHMEARDKFAEFHPQITSEFTIEEFVLEHGESFGPRIELPEGIEYGKAKECFGNAFGVAMNHRELTYAEGFAYTPGLLSVPHAWVVDKQGQVIDVTWRDGGRECGFCFGTGQEEVEIEEDEFEEQTCWWCKGTGEQDHDHPSRKGCEYLGIAIPLDDLIRIVMRKGTYGVLDSPETLHMIATKEVQNV